MTSYRQITPGEPAPYFTQRAWGTENYSIDTVAGRYLVLCFFGSSASPHCAPRLNAAFARPDLFNDDFAAFFGVTADPADESAGRVQNQLPGYRFIWDQDLTASRLYGAAPRESDDPSGRHMRPLWAVIDPSMRMIAVIPFEQDGSDITRLFRVLEAQPPAARFAGIELQAPILYLPRVFEPELCQTLIALYEAEGGELSGMMRQVGGKTIGVSDSRFKSRRDCTITDQALIRRIQGAITRRVLPEIHKVHQFEATRMERYIVSCYSAEEGGHFSAHRDNTTSGTAHRRFAVSINLNDDFDGGEVSFPEYGPRSMKAPPGGAVVFSCSLLHRVTPVTRGRRYAFLPFVYDDVAAKIRAENMASLAPETQTS